MSLRLDNRQAYYLTYTWNHMQLTGHPRAAAMASLTMISLPCWVIRSGKQPLQEAQTQLQQRQRQRQQPPTLWHEMIG